MRGKWIYDFPSYQSFLVEKTSAVKKLAYRLNPLIYFLQGREENKFTVSSEYAYSLSELDHSERQECLKNKQRLWGLYFYGLIIARTIQVLVVAESNIQIPPCTNFA